jgi:hypothetical protein
MSGSVGFMVRVWVMFGVVISPVFGFWSQHPSNNETGLEMRGIEATKITYPSSWPGEVQSFYW